MRRGKLGMNTDASYRRIKPYFCFKIFDMYEGPQNVQSQIKGRPVAACYLTCEVRNGMHIFRARDVRDLFIHRWNMGLETRWAVSKGLST